jgi:hypothetical protein
MKIGKLSHGCPPPVTPGLSATTEQESLNGAYCFAFEEFCIGSKAEGF